MRVFLGWVHFNSATAPVCNQTNFEATGIELACLVHVISIEPPALYVINILYDWSLGGIKDTPKVIGEDVGCPLGPL